MKTLDNNELSLVTGGADLITNVADGATTLSTRWGSNCYEAWGGDRNPFALVPGAICGLAGGAVGGLAGAAHTVYEGFPMPQPE